MKSPATELELLEQRRERRVREALLISETGDAEPAKLSQLTGLSVREVAVACARLQERGFIVIERSATSLPFARVSITVRGRRGR